ncbi:hypothetical protein LIA77_04296 [Sarocladium implicatum]|nr:hypothetical protein LIA77_04296 [Sarocladium implicatum]
MPTTFRLSSMFQVRGLSDHMFFRLFLFLAWLDSFGWLRQRQVAALRDGPPPPPPPLTGSDTSTTTH